MRIDTSYMIDSNWTPTVPDTSVIKEQAKMQENKLAGSVRFALGLVIGIITVNKKHK